MIKKILWSTFWIGLLITNVVFSQSYNPIHTSPYTGVVATFNNPASSINCFYKWNANLLGVSFTNNQNAFLFNTDSFSTASANGAVVLKDGSFSRYLNSIFNGQAFSFNFKIKEKHAIGLSFRTRSYLHGVTSNIFLDNYNISTLQKNYGVLTSNHINKPIMLSAHHAGWIEVNLNYSTVISQTEFTKLSIGGNLGITKSLSGFNINVSNFNYFSDTNKLTGKKYINVYDIAANQNFSNNYNSFVDEKNQTYGDAFRNFYNEAKTGYTLSAGVEYLVKSSYDYDALNNRNYDLKLGAAITDIGLNSFVSDTSTYNMVRLSNVVATDTSFDIDKQENLQINKNYNGFNIYTPTKLILQADKNWGNHFYTSAEVSINLFNTKPKQTQGLKDNSLLTITPRYETQLLGIFLPVQLTEKGNLWIGAAAKIGPLTVGLHNVATFAAQNNLRSFNGGGFLLLNIYPYINTSNDGMPCPKTLF